MASEIRVNTINNSSGLGTITISDTGAVFTGVTTITSLEVSGSLVNVSGVTTVSAGSTSAPSITPVGDPDTGIFFPSANTIAFGEGGAEAARFDSSGRFGLGTVAPQSNLHVHDGASTISRIRLTNSTTTDATAKGLLIAQNGVDLYITNNENGFLAFSTDNTERARIDNSGRLLVGTSTSSGFASARMIVNSAGTDSTGSANLVLQVGETNDSITANEQIGNIIFGDESGYTYATIQAQADLAAGSDSPGRLIFSTTADGASSATERMRIDSSGNIGIGGNPSTKLHVHSGGVLRLDNSGGTRKTQIFNDASFSEWNADVDPIRINAVHSSAYIRFDVNGSERGRINSSGQLLVGTTTSRGTGTPAMLQVAGGNGSTTFSKVAIISGNNEDAGGLILASSSTNSLNLDIDPDNLRGSSEFKVNIDATARMRIQQSGQTRFFANADSHGFKSSQTAGTDTTLFVATGGTGLDGGTLVMAVRSDGDLENANNSYGAISDVKLKENIVDAASQWDDLKALQVRRYNFKEETGFNTHTQLGLIAQEVELVSPGLVSEVPDRDEEGNDLGTTTKSVNYSVLYMKAVKALQESMERIEQLETSNADLLARVTALEAS